MYTKNILEEPLVKFIDFDHSYRSKDELLKSVTTFIEVFCPEFDEDFWSAYKTYESMLGPKLFKKFKKMYSFKSPLLLEFLEDKVDPVLFRRTRRYLIREWRTKNILACRKGTKYHWEKERLSILAGFEINPFSGQTYITRVRPYRDDCDNYSFCNNLYELEDGYYPELLLWNHQYGLAGQADKVFIETIDGVRYVDIDDYKTNDKITKDNKFSTFKVPLEHLADTKLNRYNLQLSMYAWMMEEMGFTVRNLSFHHLEEMIELKYLKQEVNIMLNYKQDSELELWLNSEVA